MFKEHKSTAYPQDPKDLRLEHLDVFQLTSNSSILACAYGKNNSKDEMVRKLADLADERKALGDIESKVKAALGYCTGDVYDQAFKMVKKHYTHMPVRRAKQLMMDNPDWYRASFHLAPEKGAEPEEEDKTLKCVEPDCGKILRHPKDPSPNPGNVGDAFWQDSGNGDHTNCYCEECFEHEFFTCDECSNVHLRGSEECQPLDEDTGEELEGEYPICSGCRDRQQEEFDEKQE